MFENFLKTYQPDTERGDQAELPADLDPTLVPLMEQLGGSVFNGGIYRVLAPADLPIWQLRLFDGFTLAKGRAQCFGIDWLGRVFATDNKRSHQDAPAVLMFEPGTGQVLEIPANANSFHNEELIHASDAALAEPFYRDWITIGGKVPRYHECIGYKKPLFMQGKDELPNMACIETSVYWGICNRFLKAVSELPPGTPVDHLSI